MNEKHERAIIDDPDFIFEDPDAGTPQAGNRITARMRARESDITLKVGGSPAVVDADRLPPDQRRFAMARERRPSRASGWREDKRRERAFAAATQSTFTSIAYSAWTRGGLVMVSAMEIAEMPDGRGTGPQWHVSISVRGTERRPTDLEFRQALACLGLRDAEEDNHHPANCRHVERR